MNEKIETIKLYGSVPLVTLQFSFSNRNIIPKIIKKISNEKQEERVERKKMKNGIQVINPTPNVSLLIFVKQLKEAGYELVDAIYQERINGNANSNYHMVKFIFSRHECAKPSENFQKYSAELDKICRQALWRVRACLNPFYKEGEEIEGKNFVSINMEVRTPIVSSKGELIQKWEKDEKGKKVGEKPLPLFPDYFLSVKGEEIKLTRVVKSLAKRAFIRMR
ncbi:hypothetical protein K8R61_01305 [bacterium]|nr:hypothetical protein [bacterium]